MLFRSSAFDNPDVGLSPRASVLESIRGTDQYKHIHALRPEGVAEEDWLTSYQSLAFRGGLGATLQDNFAENQAAAGADITRVDDAIGVMSFANNAQKRPALFNKFRNTASSMFRMVR